MLGQRGRIAYHDEVHPKRLCHASLLLEIDLMPVHDVSDGLFTRPSSEPLFESVTKGTERPELGSEM